MKMIKPINANERQKGAVSLFVVVFAALLITVVVVSFVRIMVNDEQQASTVDLSQSAYDSAQAGIEDAKRALIRYQNICANSDDSECSATMAKIISNECNISLSGVVSAVGGEVKVQQNSSDNALDQAYTCVKIKLKTDDYLGLLQANGSAVVPLVSDASFDRIILEWYSADDLQSDTDLSVDLPGVWMGAYPLPNQSSWPVNRPSIMRSQLMQFGNNFKLSDFDDTNSSGQSNANTLFLYPSSNAIITKSFTGSDVRKNPIGSLSPIKCANNLTSGGYACKVTLTLPDPINPKTDDSRTAFLRLTSLYSGAHYRVSLMNGSTSIQFDGVQPEIDSTGRANELFRRVTTRVELRDTSFPYPEAAVDTTGNICKDFLITDSVGDYQNNNCTE